MPISELENIKLYYDSKGNGEPLLLISDITQDSQSWEHIHNNLSRHFRVITFDNRCSGRSDYADSGFTISDMAQDVINLLNFLKIERAHILGHGMGGFVAQEIAIQHPDRVLKLILEDSSPFLSLRNKLLFENLFSAETYQTD